MKTLFASIFVLIMMGFNEPNYETAMRTQLDAMKTASSLTQRQAIVNAFQRIGEAEPQQWLPPYYAALNLVYMSFDKTLPNKERDELLEQATLFAEETAKRDGNPVEVTVLKGYIAMAKLSVNPAIRGAMMSAKVSRLFGTALGMDATNPRAVIMHARWKYGSAQFFKRNTDEACALAASSIPLFQAEPQEVLTPTWGLATAKSMAKACAK